MSIQFTINQKPYRVNLGQLPADINLNTFIREHAHLKGTKFMCLEGGCGVCICVIRGRHPITKEYKTWATNSCLTMLYSCNGWDIVTIEGIGNRKDGYHAIQKRLAHMNGSQCGYCSPAMVMNMYALLEAKGNKLTMEEIENSYGGNICRCTGYRPILDAMKLFATDSSYEYIGDIEECLSVKVCPKTGSQCFGVCHSNQMLRYVYDNGTEWCETYSLKDIFDGFSLIGNKKYMLVAGNTGHGVFRRPEDIEVFIDVNKVPELHKNTLNDNRIEFGGNLSLTEAMDTLLQAGKSPGYEYCKQIYDHFDIIANVPVRNMGTLGGNLAMKHAVKGFPSDVYITFEAVDAQVHIAESPTEISAHSVQEFLATDMTKKVIKGFTLRPLPANEYLFNSYKIMPRAQNAHAYVNAAFLVKYVNNKVEFARLCFGGINPEFTHAVETENFLTGKDIFDPQVTQEAMKILKSELKPDWELPDASPEYRQLLACGLFYKFILGYTPDGKIKKEYKSGGDKLKRELSGGIYTFETNTKEYPLTEPKPKMEALVQCAGEAEYMNDYPTLPNEVFCAFVLAQQANVKIAEIDPSNALKIPGVIAFFGAKDIPANNSFVIIGLLGYGETEEIFCSDTVRHHGQPVGIIVAENTKLAEKAAKLVKVMYEKRTEPVLATLQDVFEKKAYNRITNTANVRGKGKPVKGLKATKKIEGMLDMGSQYHYTMEPQTCVCVPKEDGIEVFTASQWMDSVQNAIAQMLGMQQNYIRVKVRRLGGGYGAKVSRSNQIACATALASKLLNRPVRFIMTIESMMASLGKRMPCHCDYEVEVTDSGKIVKLKNDFASDVGCTHNESPLQFLTIHCVKGCYQTDSNWVFNGTEVITDAPSHTWCRGPGAIEGIAMIENIMDHIAVETGKDPVDVRLENIANDHRMKTLLPEYMKTIDYKARRENIDKFNKENRWRKRGIGIACMQYPIEYFGSFNVTVAIYEGDGSVSLTHGGIEMGQGINTKAAQVVARFLGIPLEKVKVEPGDSFESANSIASGGGVASESVAMAAKKACEDLNARLKPIRDSMKDAKWEDVIKTAYGQGINLIANNSAGRSDIKEYTVWGVGCCEVEIDLLTGNLIVQRVDILEDTGESMNPLLDIGQCEGAFIMGLGYWLTELLVFNRETGQLLTTRTWNYKPPGAKDIPVDFRVNFIQKNPNPAGVLRSKTVGEPPICLAISVMFAIRHALRSAREDAGVNEKWFHLGAPTTPEHIMLNSGSTPEMFNLL